MKRFLLLTSVNAFLLYCLAIASARPAYGYVDPGSGFLAVQTIASVAAAFGYFLRKRIRDFFGGGKKADEPATITELHDREQRSAK